MKANRLTWTFLLLLTVAAQLPAQQSEADSKLRAAAAAPETFTFEEAQQSEADRKLLADIREKAEKGDANSQEVLAAAFYFGIWAKRRILSKRSNGFAKPPSKITPRLKTT